VTFTYSGIACPDQSERCLTCPILLLQRFESLQKVADVYHPYSMPYQHFEVFYCRGLKQPLKEIWPPLKQRN